jgi:hypothetical protein
VHEEQLQPAPCCPVTDTTPFDTTRVLTKAFLEVVKALAVKDPATTSATAERAELVKRMFEN